MRKAVLGAVLVSVLLAASPADAIGPARWSARIDAARTYAQSRAGLIAFAVVDERGRLHGYRASAVAPSASVLKAMLLVAYLRKASVRDRSLTDYERGLLGPMIRRSDNNGASTILGLVGRRGVMRLAAVSA